MCSQHTDAEFVEQPPCLHTLGKGDALADSAEIVLTL